MDAAHETTDSDVTGERVVIQLNTSDDIAGSELDDLCDELLVHCTATIHRHPDRAEITIHAPPLDATAIGQLTDRIRRDVPNTSILLPTAGEWWR